MWFDLGNDSMYLSNCEHSYYQTDIWFGRWTCLNTTGALLSKQQKAPFRSSADRFRLNPASNKERRKKEQKSVNLGGYTLLWRIIQQSPEELCWETSEKVNKETLDIVVYDG